MPERFQSFAELYRDAGINLPGDVTLADIADNADESRLELLDDKTADRLRRKYAKALKALGQ